jgi:acyl CoA:acetate/3-ketoacid CoA transferase alpha subunit
VCIAEVEELVEPGQLNPDEIHLPGIYVQRIVKGTLPCPVLYCAVVVSNVH